MSSYSEYAEFILYSPDLESKLTPPDSHLTDSLAPQKLDPPSIPTRHSSIAMTDEKSKIPRLEHLNDPRNVGLSLHHFANHELMAIELFAWALLKFPDAPAGVRRGFLKSLQEEQSHFRLYQMRMEELGIGFGDRPLNRLFWKQISKMETLEKFSAVLSISFEGANLDFSQVYKQAFAFHGDEKSATIMETVFEDEVRHVKRGLAVFKKTKPNDMNEWEYFQSLLEFPFTPRRAKGYFYIPETRRRVGFSEPFIESLGKYEDQYTGRVHLSSLEKVGIDIGK
ncbi:MAG: DUF455 family protein [Leptospira sp.]|nr:DUF455 family protein [Leptospira sp.]